MDAVTRAPRIVVGADETDNDEGMTAVLEAPMYREGNIFGNTHMLLVAEGDEREYEESDEYDADDEMDDVTVVAVSNNGYDADVDSVTVYADTTGSRDRSGDEDGADGYDGDVDSVTTDATTRHTRQEDQYRAYADAEDTFDCVCAWGVEKLTLDELMDIMAPLLRQS